MEDKCTADPLKDENLFQKSILAQGKLGYVRGEAKPMVDCILCEIIKGNPSIPRHVVWEDEACIIMLNLYPYNPGHAMVLPKTHIERLHLLPSDLLLHLFTLVQKIERAQEIAFKCVGWNIGVNDGDCSGQSIKHLHVHVVPRFASEVGFLDIIGKTRTVAMQIDYAFQQLRDAFLKLS